MDPEPESTAYPAPAKGCRFNPWLFFGFLIAPGILSLLMLLHDDRNYGEKALVVLMVGSAIAGLVCGIHFTLAQRSQATWLRVVIGIVAVIGCAGGAFALGIGTCFLVTMVLESL